MARAIATKYGVDPEQILARLRAGRFRVKANLDLSAAKRFMEYLESEGALCSVVDASGRVVAHSAAVTPTPPPSSEPDDFLPLYTPPPAADAGQYESGLAAGFSGGSDSQDLGVIADDAAAWSGSLRLSVLGGDSSESKGGPSVGSVAETSDVAAFLPPDALVESKLELAEDDEPEALPAYEQPPIPSPPPQQVVEQYERADEAGETAHLAVPGTSATRRGIQLALVSSRGRLALGVLLAFVVGFVLSSFIASSMEDNRYAKAVDELEAAYVQADSVDAWLELDAVRADTVESLERRRRNIVITSLLVWLVSGGLLLFLWLRFIDWARLEESVASAG
ncbi:MAG: hypothetical protein GY811_08495 [Myxococcales bacterium]|nr:hypothetical protein [Myxococcales bacterium]